MYATQQLAAAFDKALVYRVLSCRYRLAALSRRHAGVVNQQPACGATSHRSCRVVTRVS